MVKLNPVESSYIDMIGHDPASNQLHVQFKDGSQFSYDAVPAKLHAEMLKSDSIGSFFHGKIKPHYKGTKIGDKTK